MYLDLSPLQIQRNERSRQTILRRLAAERAARLDAALLDLAAVEKERVGAAAAVTR